MKEAEYSVASWEISQLQLAFHSSSVLAARAGTTISIAAMSITRAYMRFFISFTPLNG